MTHTTLYDGKDDPRNKRHFHLRPAASVTINLSPYITEYIEIDVLGKS